ncbi:MAG: YCF48-related protein [Thermaurantimonas sp.]
MKHQLLLFLLIFSLQNFGQVLNEQTPTTQGLWGAGENNLGELFMVGNNGTIIRRSAGCTGTWSSVTTSTTAGLRAVVFTGDSIGIAVGTSGTLLRSTNHGASWAPVVSGTTAGLLDVIAEDSVVMAVGGGAASGNVVIRSSDYGQTWTTVVSTLPASPFSIARVTDNTFVLCGVQGTVFRTTDKGFTWTAVTGPFAGTLTSVDFFDNQNGLICGQNGGVYKTTDGGLSWVQVSYNVTTFFNSGIMLKPWRYLLVGNGGVALQTDSAGLSQVVDLSTSQAMRVTYRHRDRIYIAGNQGLVYSIPYDGHYPTLFQENFCAFTDSVQPPAGWFNQSSLPNRTWRFNDPFPQSTGISQSFVAPFASYQTGFFGPGGDSAWLITPVFSTTGALYPLVQWNEYILPPLSGTMTMTIQAFNGIQWTTIYQSNGFLDGTSNISIGSSPKLKNTARRSAILPLPNQMDVQLRFIISSNGANGGVWIIDDIRVINSPYDVRLDSVIYHSVCSPVTVDQPEAVVYNSSTVDHYPVSTELWTASGLFHRTLAEILPPAAFYTLPLVNSPIAVSNGDSMYARIISQDSSLLNNGKSFEYHFLLSSPGTNGAHYQLCGNDTLFIALTPDPGISVSWTLNGLPYSNQPFIEVFQAGIYRVIYSQGNCTVTDSIVVTQVPSPTNPLLTVKDTFSFGEVLTIPVGTADSIEVNVFHSTLGMLAQVVSSTDVTITLPANPGELSLSVTHFKDSCAFAFFKSAQLLSGLSISGFSFSGFRVYPNPADQLLNVEFGDPIRKLTIFDTSGKMVYSRESDGSSIFVGELKPGLYVIQLEDLSGRKFMQGFIKK